MDHPNARESLVGGRAGDMTLVQRVTDEERAERLRAIERREEARRRSGLPGESWRPDLGPRVLPMAEQMRQIQDRQIRLHAVEQRLGTTYTPPPFPQPLATSPVPGSYGEHLEEYREGQRDSLMEYARDRDEATPKYNRYVQLKAQLTALEAKDPAFVKANTEIESSKSKGSWRAVTTSVDQVIPLIENTINTRKNTDSKTIGRFQNRIKTLQQKVDAALEAKGVPNIVIIRKSLRADISPKLPDLERETLKGVSRADEAALDRLEKRYEAIMAGKTVPDTSQSTPVVDPDEDGRTGVEPVLIYRGDRYDKMPGFDRLYGRIEPSVSVSPDALAEYQAALLKGKIPPNEKGENGTKEKAKHWELKLTAARAKALGIGATTRIINKSNPVKQPSTGIQYILFNKLYDAH